MKKQCCDICDKEIKEGELWWITHDGQKADVDHTYEVCQKCLVKVDNYIESLIKSL